MSHTNVTILQAGKPILSRCVITNLMYERKVQAVINALDVLDDGDVTWTYSTVKCNCSNAHFRTHEIQSQHKEMPYEEGHSRFTYCFGEDDMREKLACLSKDPSLVSLRVDSLLSDEVK